MKPYLVSLCVGLLVGLIYSLLGVRSPAPPVTALIGLFGMLVGEQAVPLLRAKVAGMTASAAAHRDAARQVLGPHAGRATDQSLSKADS